MNASKSTSRISLVICSVISVFAIACASSDDKPGPTGGAAGTNGGLMAGFTTDNGGYVISGAWHGWPWPATENPTKGTTITPAPSDATPPGPGFSAVTAGSPLCVSGTVAMDSLYGGVGLLGVSINQDKTPDNAPTGTWTPTGTGVKWQITNTGPSPLRIQINGTAGYPTQAWCNAIISGTGPSKSGTINWADFNSQCWAGGNGTPYDGTTPIKEVIVVVPGLNTATQAFDFCLEGIGPA
jgi:hypothetical protein